MIKIFTLLVCLSPLIASGQTGPFKTLPKDVPIVEPKDVLVIEGDSVYNFLSDVELRQKLSKGHFDIVNQPDSVQHILNTRIKAIIIIKKEEGKLKSRKKRVQVQRGFSLRDPRFRGRITSTLFSPAR